MWQNSIGELTTGRGVALADFLEEERGRETEEKGRDEGRMTCGGLLKEKEGVGRDCLLLLLLLLFKFSLIKLFRGDIGNVTVSVNQLIVGLCFFNQGIPNIISNESIGKTNNDSHKSRSLKYMWRELTNLQVEVTLPSANLTTCELAVLTVGI